MKKQRSKLSLPDWKIEPRYSNDVLIGNWLEERLQFQKGSSFGTSSQRAGYRPPEGHLTDKMTRQMIAEHQKKGVGRDFLLCHHGKAYHPSQMSNYDLSYSRWFYDPPLGTGPLLDMLKPRRWHRHKCSWVPEKLDVTLQGTLGMHGVYESLKVKRTVHYYAKNKWAKDTSATRDDNLYRTVQKESYKRIPPIKILDANEGLCTLRYRHRKTDIRKTHPSLTRDT